MKVSQINPCLIDSLSLVLPFQVLSSGKLAKQTALIDEEGGSLLRYALSYLQVCFEDWLPNL